jgi:hypothetical protein
MAKVEIITGPERGRSWSEQQKRANVDAGFAPGAIVAGRPRAAVCAGQIGRSIAGGRSWDSPGSGFSRVVIAATDVGSDNRAALDPVPVIGVELAGATRLRIPASTPPNWRRPLRQ